MIRGAHVASERILYLPQELTARDGIAMLDAVRDLNAGERGRVLALVAALGIDPDRLLESAAPSPGEARKLAMAYGLGRQVWAMVLDEPTESSRHAGDRTPRGGIDRIPRRDGDGNRTTTPSRKGAPASNGAWLGEGSM